MASVCRMFNAACTFLRIHRSFVIAIDKITAFTQNDVEIGDQEIPIGKLYRYQLGKLSKP